MDIKSTIKAFQWLSLEQKQEKLLSILRELQDKNDVFAALLTKVSNTIPNEATLTVIYYDIMMFGEAILAYNTTKNESSLSKAEEYMQKLLQREQQERLANDQDLAQMESLLQNM